jgi:hypothetical protein
MADVFISYSQKSPASAKTLAEALQAKRIDVWWDRRLVAGERFDDVIRDQLLSANAVIVIWTPESIQSTYVKMEASIAWGFNKLVPVRVADLPSENIPDPFRAFQADVVTDVDRVLRALAGKDILPQEWHSSELIQRRHHGRSGRSGRLPAGATRGVPAKMSGGAIPHRYQAVHYDQGVNSEFW